MTRLEQLHQFLVDEPTDPFNKYALALEYLKSDQAEAMRLFDELLTEHDNYLPVYYTAGKIIADTGNTERAIRIFETGIEKARQQQQDKTARELKSALDEIRFD